MIVVLVISIIAEHCTYFMYNNCTSKSCTTAKSYDYFLIAETCIQYCMLAESYDY